MDTVIVASSQFYSHYPKRIPRGTVNAEAVLIRLDSEWDSLTVRIHWLNVASGVEKVVLLERDQPNTIPWEVLADLSELRMGLDGMDGGTIVKPTVWLTYGYVVDGVDPEAGSDPQPPTPSWEQQMVALAEAAANAAKAAKETADNLQVAAESGEFNGDPGPAGPPGKSPIIRNGTWWIWNNDSQDYTDTGVVASGGGGGVSSYNDLSDRPTIGGVLLEGNKTAQDLGLQPKGDYATTSSKLANPFSITFTGAVEATYDGSQEKTVEIPTIAGPAGVSPTVSTEEIDGGTRVTFMFKGGSETIDILNGKTPLKGIDYGTEQDIQKIARQAAALVPGGGSKRSRLISSGTLKSESDVIGVTEDLSGGPFVCSILFITINTVATASNVSESGADLFVNNLTNSTGRVLINIPRVFRPSANNGFSAVVLGDGPIVFASGSSTSGTVSNSNNIPDRQGLTSIYVKGGVFGAESTWEVWGVDL